MRPEGTTVGELIRLVDEDRLDDAWSLAKTEIDALVRSRRVRRTATVEDAASESLIRIFDGGQSPLRRADPRCPLRAWLRGVLTNVRREMRRSQPARVDSTIVERAAAPDVRREKPRVGRGVVVDLHLLTPKQRSAVELRIRGLSWGSIARMLGISQRAARDRVDSAVRRLRKRRNKDLKYWARDCLRSNAPLPTRMPQESARRMLRMHAEGASYREISLQVDASPEAVRHRIRRIRNQISPVLGRNA